MPRTPSDPAHSPAYRLGGLVLVGAAAVILTALAFEHLGGYLPCPLCLQQRYAYYAGIPLLFLALVALAAERQGLAIALFLAVAAGFVVNAGLGAYQAGAEWGFWPGPETCARTLEPLRPVGRGLLEDLGSTRVVRCDVASWRLLGLSFAGWNVVASLMLAAGGILSALRIRRRPRSA
jgi:disulfide bond formation protein DsbB